MALPTVPYNPGAPSRQVDPAGFAAAVTPNDDTDVAPLARGVFVGVGGDLTVVMEGSLVTTTFKNVGDGQLLPIRVRRVMATGTTATNILTLW